MDRGERYLRRRDAPQIIPLDEVRVISELRQLTGRGQRRRRHQRRRTHLLEGIGIRVERVLTQRARQRRTSPSLHGEHRSGDLRGPLVVEDAEIRPNLPVRNTLMLSEAPLTPLGQERSADHRVVRVAGPVGNLVARNVRDHKQQFTKSCGERVVLGGQLGLLRAKFAALPLQRLGRCDISLATESADLAGHLVHPRADLIATSGDLPKPSIDILRARDEGVELQIASACERSTHLGGVRTKQSNVNHRSETTARFSAESGAGRAQRSSTTGVEAAKARSTSSVVRGGSAGRRRSCRVPKPFANWVAKM